MNQQRTNHPNKHSLATSIRQMDDSNTFIDIAASFQRFAVIYLRPGQRQLPPEAIRDLEQYLEMLRSYYGIPADRPVFPPRPKTAQHTIPAAKRPGRPSKSAKNPAGHPWRTA